MKRLHLHIMLSMLIVILTFSVDAVGYDKIVKIHNLKNINLCENDDRTFTFEVSIGEIKKEDKFVGYDLWIAYDSTKLTIKNYLPMNSITEFITSSQGVGMVKHTYPGSSKIYLRMYAVAMSGFVSGNRHLIAFKGEVFGDIDNDIIPIEIDQFEIYNTSTDRINDFQFKNDSIIVSSQKNEDYFFNIVKLDDINLIDANDVSFDLNYNLGNKKIDNLDFILSTSNGNCLEFTNIYENESSYRINSIVAIEKNKSLIKGSLISKTNTSNSILLTVKAKFINQLSDSCLIKFEPLYSNDCFSDISGTEFKVTNKIPIDATENESFSIIEYKDYISVYDKNNILNIELYDLLGKSIYNSQGYDNKLIKSDFTNGLYLLKIQNNEKILIKKIIINN